VRPRQSLGGDRPILYRNAYFAEAGASLMSWSFTPDSVHHREVRQTALMIKVETMKNSEPRRRTQEHVSVREWIR